MRFSNVGDIRVTGKPSSHICTSHWGGSEWMRRIGTKVEIIQSPANAKEKCPVCGTEVIFEYEIKWSDGMLGYCNEVDLVPSYDGNEKSSWETLRGIYQPNKTKEPTPCA